MRFTFMPVKAVQTSSGLDARMTSTIRPIEMPSLSLVPMPILPVVHPLP